MLSVVRLARPVAVGLPGGISQSRDVSARGGALQAERGDFGPGDKDELVEQVLNLDHGGKTTSWERTFPDGRTLRFNSAPTPEGGNAQIVTDITDRKRAEEELAEKEAQLRVALDNMPGGMLMFDKDHRVTVLNDQYRQLLDVPEDLMVEGGSAERAIRFRAERGDFGPGDVDDLVGKVMAILMSREPTRYERRLSTGRVLEISRAPTPEGGTVAVYSDITERKRAEEELAEKEAQLRVALDHMPGGMALGDRDLNYVLFNSQYSELLEFPDGLVRAGTSFRDELRFQADRGDFGPGDKDDLIEQVVAPYQKGEAVSYEREIAGSGRTLHFIGAPTPEGGYVSIITDCAPSAPMRHLSGIE